MYRVRVSDCGHVRSSRRRRPNRAVIRLAEVERDLGGVHGTGVRLRLHRPDGGGDGCYLRAFRRFRRNLVRSFLCNDSPSEKENGKNETFVH
jgi:hypothetical protein